MLWATLSLTIFAVSDLLDGTLSIGHQPCIKEFAFTVCGPYTTDNGVTQEFNLDLDVKPRAIRSSLRSRLVEFRIFTAIARIVTKLERDGRHIPCTGAIQGPGSWGGGKIKIIMSDRNQSERDESFRSLKQFTR